jgi:hypothetical protein
LRWVAGTFVAGDLVSRRTSSATSPLSAQADQDFFLVSLGLRGRQELRLTRALAVTLGASADILLNPVEFESIKVTEEERIARTARLRWCIDLGIKVSAF